MMDTTDDGKFLPGDFLERCVFPVLLPGLEATLRTAKTIERRKCFNPLDYLSAYLYRNNPSRRGREDVTFEEIPFVKETWSTKPRPPLPLSATLTEEEAAIIIQAYYKGYILRSKNPHVVELRKWQKCYWREQIAAPKIQSWWRRMLAKKTANPAWWSRVMSAKETTAKEAVKKRKEKLENIKTESCKQ